MELTDAVVAITGGAGGLGQAIAAEFRRVGARPVTLDLDAVRADIALDVTDRAATRAALASIRDDAGRLDVVVANAGVGVGGSVDDLTDADWDRAIAVNVSGLTHTVRAGYELMAEQGRGAIVVMASLSGLLPTPLLTPYSMSKHAAVGLAASLRPEAARRGIGVTVVCPGPVDTPMLDAAAATAGLSARRYLTAAAGPAIAPAQVAAALVDGVRGNRAIVTPGRAGLLARLARFAPAATARKIAKNAAAEFERAAH